MQDTVRSTRPQSFAGSIGSQGSAIGLQNQEGEHNCWTNGILQCLWDSKSFRESVLKVSIANQHLDERLESLSCHVKVETCQRISWEMSNEIRDLSDVVFDPVEM